MKILITGGSGFIGTNLIDLLLTKEDIQILNYDKSAPVKESHARFWTNGNIMDPAFMCQTFKEFLPDSVIHLAARTDTLSDQLADYAENTVGTQNVLDAIKKTSSIKHAIITSTQYVYKSDYQPYPSHDEDFLPHTVYGQSKVLTEQFTRSADLACNWTIIRPTNIWGPWHMRYPNELWKVIDKGVYFHPVNHSVLRTYGYVKNIVHQIHQIMIASPSLVHKKMYYVGDAPIDSFKWLDELSVQMTQKHLKRLPKFIFQGIAIGGDMLRAMRVPFPLYSKRFKNMIEDYPAPTAITIKLFGQAEADLKHNVEETLEWLKAEGKPHFDHWKNK